MSALLLATLGLLSADGVAIESGSGCPDAAAVRAELVPLAAAPEPALRVAVDQAEGHLQVTLTWPGDGAQAVRKLPLDGDCAARARAVALVIASWLGETSGPVLPAPALPSPPARAVPAKRAPPPPSATAPAARAAVPSKPSATVTFASARHTELGVGVLVDAGGGWASGLRLDVARTATSSGLGTGVHLSATNVRETPLGGGLSRWTRVVAGVSGRGRLRLRHLQLEAEAGAVAALTLAWGDGYDVDTTSAGLTPGLSGGGRVGVPLGVWTLWLEGRALGWLREQRLRHRVLSNNDLMVVRLPTAEAQITLGASYLFP